MKLEPTANMDDYKEIDQEILADDKKLLEIITQTELAVLANPSPNKETQFSALKTLMAARAQAEARIMQIEESIELARHFAEADINRQLEALTEFKL